jgi:hypothetical protein
VNEWVDDVEKEMSCSDECGSVGVCECKCKSEVRCGVCVVVIMVVVVGFWAG